MWEGEFIEFCKTAKCAWMTDEEARAKWQEYKAHPNTPRDCKGPKGFQRLGIPVKDTIQDFEEVAKARILGRSENMGKKASQDEDELNRRTQAVLNFGSCKHRQQSR